MNLLRSHGLLGSNKTANTGSWQVLLTPPGFRQNKAAGEKWGTERPELSIPDWETVSQGWYEDPSLLPLPRWGWL